MQTSRSYGSPGAEGAAVNICLYAVGEALLTVLPHTDLDELTTADRDFVRAVVNWLTEDKSRVAVPALLRRVGRLPSREGHVLVETAFAWACVGLVLYAIVLGAMGAFNGCQVCYAAQDTARYAALHPDADIAAYARSLCVGFTPDVEVTYTPPGVVIVENVLPDVAPRDGTVVVTLTYGPLTATAVEVVHGQ